MTAGRGKRVFLLGLCLLGTLGFAALGVWQVERLFWKRDLIARVEARLAAPLRPVPPRGAWSSLDPREAEYRRVEAIGTFLHERETRVDALTALGPGFWVITPLRTSDGIILVNRGFVPPDRGPSTDRPAGRQAGWVRVTGLLRLSEPDGRFLRPNRPEEERWFSRDVPAIARARGLDRVAPFFIDADAAANPRGGPVAGLTVVRFRDTPLVYALTWFGLAGLSLAGLVLLLKPTLRPSRWTRRSSR